MMYGGDHGEFAYVRVSCQVFICWGMNVTRRAPRYTIHDSHSLFGVAGTVCVGGR